ncbi:MAG TPA: hypothetical protein VKT75_08985 [Acidobacteriaceae bacterium]|jgi:hypothetical protein|nr:hypothetical protein [Acidobacteriaceae bacterium]
MDDWRRYIETRILRDRLEDQVAFCKQRLRNGDLNSLEGRSLKQELTECQTVLNDFVSRMGLN